ncbi:hypothetical protein ACSJLP_24465 [Gordonia rhizosphera NBRC 16068]|uniref:Uncharacterized protein n=1 Tax=Gordonia rhizosphera NBRC 16068 TaxID=1108045 RepID=K6X1P4_9ACTN|nr:hypothetical protein GORHZ_188_00110 [Gordonia rhizosphera NBRC 16068]
MTNQNRIREQETSVRTWNRDWTNYLAWNTAVADVVYPETSEPAPAYMDLDDDQLRLIASQAGYDGTDPAARLASVVRAVTARQGRLSLRTIVRETRIWHKKATLQEAPPCIAFLAVTVLAAEDMGNTSEGLASNAYYARLAPLLDVPSEDSSIVSQYRSNIEELWDATNGWLASLEGRRGLPSAFALSHRFVGLPMSQALVRAADRARLPHVFAQYGLTPGMHLAPSDLTPYLDEWLSSEHSTATHSLRTLWQRKDSHERISSVAAIELANWDGNLIDSSAFTQARALLVANLRDGFMGSSLDLSVGVRLPPGPEPHAEVLQSGAKWTPLTLNPGTAGLWRTSYTQSIDFVSVLDGLIDIRCRPNADEIRFQRRPREIVPLVYDELQTTYVETDRLQLGVDALILVRSQSPTRAKESAAQAVIQTLDEYARPGFECVTSFPGLPPGWLMLRNVQLFGIPAALNDRLNALIPLARNQLTVAGGLRIPSRVQKWSSLSPPEVRAMTHDQRAVRVELKDTSTGYLVHTWESVSGTLTASLRQIGLKDGDYQVSLFLDGKKEPLQQVAVRLRSSDTEDALWDQVTRLRYSLDTPLGTMTATELDSNTSDRYADGLYVESNPSPPSTKYPASSAVTWHKKRVQPKRRPLQIGTPDPDSCVVTGAHHWDFPKQIPGSRKSIQGVCRSCGLVKRYPGWLPRSPRTRPKAAHVESPPTSIDLSQVGPVQNASPASWESAYDALMHLGGGSFSKLESIATQIEGSALFVDTFVRALESLGHIAIERSSESWKPTAWEVSPTSLAGTASGSYRAVGFWARATAQDALVSARDMGGTSEFETSKGMQQLFIAELNTDSLNLIAGECNADVVENPGATMLSALPALSNLAASCPRIAMPGYDSAERFELETASWVPTGDTSVPGAYKIQRSFEVLYVFRSPTDTENNTAARVPVHVAKHLAANAAQRSLIVYFDTSASVVLPRGCDLPGLYNRAAVALSGHLPEERALTVARTKRDCLFYRGFTRADADTLNTLLVT